jgi:acetamidase/formamidase
VVLQPGTGPIDGQHYLASGPETISWGWLPNRTTAPVMTVDSGDTLTVDTVSHEGLLEDFGRDPVGWFGRHGVARGDVLTDGVRIADEVERAVGSAGPHVVTGPVAVRGAEPGDLLRIDVLGARPRVSYGVISTRHGKGALAGELPAGPAPDESAPLLHPNRWRTISVFTEIVGGSGTMPLGDGRVVRYPIAPFPGLIGVGLDTDRSVNSMPPGSYGGNLDVRPLAVGSSVYLPVQLVDGLLYTGDPHFAQGNGEVCVTALEGSLRLDLRVTVLRGDAARRAVGILTGPFGETDDHWIPIGLDVDLGEAMRDAVRNALRFLETRFAMPRHLAYAYLSAAADFEVSQVVDGVQGVHCLIRKRDFEGV